MPEIHFPDVADVFLSGISGSVIGWRAHIHRHRTEHPAFFDIRSTILIRDSLNAVKRNLLGCLKPAIHQAAFIAPGNFDPPVRYTDLKALLIQLLLNRQEVDHPFSIGIHK